MLCCVVYYFGQADLEILWLIEWYLTDVSIRNYDLPDLGHLSKLKGERRAQMTCVKEDWHWLLMSSWWWLVKVYGIGIGWPQAPGPCSEPSVKCGLLRPVSLSAPTQHTTAYCVSVKGTGLRAWLHPLCWWSSLPQPHYVTTCLT